MKKKIHEYEGKNVTVRYDVARCIHARECVRGLPQVFDPNRRPWVDADATAADEVTDVILRCPTGALHFHRNDGGPQEPVPTANTIRVTPDGPLYVEADVEIIDANGLVVLEDTRVALCRCGGSQNKPLCDGRHSTTGFQAPGTLAKSSPPPDGFTPTGKLMIKPLADGALRLEGSFEIRSAGGDASFYATKASLCRCGASGTKPFCDRSHRTIGFTAR